MEFLRWQCLGRVESKRAKIPGGGHRKGTGGFRRRKSVKLQLVNTTVRPEWFANYGEGIAGQKKKKHGERVKTPSAPANVFCSNTHLVFRRFPIVIGRQHSFREGGERLA